MVRKNIRRTFAVNRRAWYSKRLAQSPRRPTRGEEMRVMPIIGEDTVFLVESRSLQCPRCTRHFSGKGKLMVGDPCPHCAPNAIVKRMLPHRVDIACIFPIGQCGCWHATKLNPAAIPLSKRLAMTHEEQEALRCFHIKLARGFALNRELSRGEKIRLANGRGECEERQP